MKGIYLTQEAKDELEAKIAEIEKNEDPNSECWGIATSAYREILKEAIVLPVYTSLEHAMQNKDLDNPIGIIIQPKKKESKDVVLGYKTSLIAQTLDKNNKT